MFLVSPSDSEKNDWLPFISMCLLKFSSCACAATSFLLKCSLASTISFYKIQRWKFDKLKLYSIYFPRPWRVDKKPPQGGSVDLFFNTNHAKLVSFIDSTDQLCDPFLSYFIDLDVVYLIMMTQLLCNCSFPHCRRPNQKDSDWLQK